MRKEYDVCECGRPIIQPHKGARRLKCVSCSPSKAKKIVSLPLGDFREGDVSRVVVGAINAVGKKDTPAGALAIHLAALLDQGGHTGPAAAALARECRAACNEALANATVEGDILDELKARRRGGA